MAPGRIPVCFDVLGTCFSFEAATKALLSVFPHLSELHADSIIQDWFHSAQRDYSFTSMGGSYQPIAQFLKLTLPRIYLMHNLVTTHEEASDQRLLDPVISAIPKMPPRPSLLACTELLSKSQKFNLWAVTNGGLETTKGYFYNAFGGKDIVEKSLGWTFMSCDEIQTAKPSPKVYEEVWERLKKEAGDGAEINRDGWFVASHTWDLHAAKKAGFKTAFVTYEEHLVLPDLFGQPDIVARDLEEAAKQIIAHEEQR